MTSSPVLWYLNRATGTVLLVLLTAVVVLGVLATFGHGRRVAARLVPRFAVQSLHRQLTLVTMVLLAAHVVSAVIDTYVDIRWRDAVVPFAGTYRPVWLGFGTLALDLIAVVVATSLMRARLGLRRWRAVHLASYVAWALGLVHGWGIGTDEHALWARQVTLGCLLVVGLAAIVRLGVAARPSPEAVR